MVMVQGIKNFTLSGFPCNKVTDRLGEGKGDSQVGVRQEDTMAVDRSLVGWDSY